MANTYDVGDLVRCSVIFANAAGAAADPTLATFKFKKPSGSTTYVEGVDAQLVDDTGAGAFYVDLSISEVGDWWYRWEGTGTVETAVETRFTVRKTQF